MEDLLSPRQLADELGVSVGFLAQRRYMGDGPPFMKLSPRKVIYRRGEVETSSPLEDGHGGSGYPPELPKTAFAEPITFSESRPSGGFPGVETVIAARARTQNRFGSNCSVAASRKVPVE